MRVFLVYVRPIVEYNSIIWPLSIPPESVQRRFTKPVVSYRERLKCLNIFSLEVRRLHTDLFSCCKIGFGLVYVNLDDLFVFSSVSELVDINLSSSSAKPFRANFFSERVINFWNSLPHTVYFSSFSKLKRTVKRVDFTDFLLY